MTISELIVTLQQRRTKHGDLEVCATWEGVIRDLSPSNVYKSANGYLLIDADENFYKERLAEDPFER